LATAAIGGLATLGLWTLAYRALQAPVLFFDSLLRVSFPAMSRIVAMQADAVAVIKRALVVGTVAFGVILAPLAASSPALIPAIFGGKWADAADILPPACLGLVIALPVTLGLTGYLWAIGDAQLPLRASVANGIVLLLVATALLPFLGAAAIGVAFAAAAAVSAIVIRRGAARYVDLSLSPLVAPTIVWVITVGLGWIAISRLDASLGIAVTGALLTEAVYVGAMAIVARSQLRETLSFVRSAFQGRLAELRGRPAHAAARA
jgi:O-antigen/teichoic acid export membrane protein